MMLSRRLRENLLIALLIAGVLSIFSWIGLFRTTDLRFSDRLFVPREPSGNIVIVAIDDKSIQAIGRWPWSRAVHAEMVDKLTAFGARTIGYDLNFSEPDLKDQKGDQKLIASVRAGTNVVLPVEFDLRRTSSGYVGSAPLYPLPELKEKVILGHTNMTPDPDGVIRTVPVSIFDSVANAHVKSFAAVIDAGFPIELGMTDGDGMLRINYAGPPGTFPRYSFSDVLDGKIGADKFKDKMVLVGATAPDLHDEQLTPVSRGVLMPGVELHANAVETLISGKYLQVASPAVAIALIFLFTFIVGFLVSRGRLRYGTIALVVILAGYFFAVLIAFEMGWILPIVFPILAALLSYLVLVAVRYFFEQKERQRTRKALEQYVSPQVVGELLRKPEMLKLGGERRTMTVLFSDLRGFTSLSEGLDPQKLVQILNHYLDVMTETVFETNGVVDKYMGDAIMAFWGAPFQEPNHADRAIRTALRMRTILGEMNRTKSWPHGVTLQLGIGLNTGDMVVGNIGSDRRFDYTVLGDAVNLGSRLEGLNKEYGTQIIVSGATKLAASDEFLFRPLDLVAVKGKKEPVEIFEVVSEMIPGYVEALQLYRNRKFTEAAEKFEEIAQKYPEDAPTTLYIERARAFAKNPPPADWNGVWVYTKK